MVSRPCATSRCCGKGREHTDSRKPTSGSWTAWSMCNRQFGLNSTGLRPRSALVGDVKFPRDSADGHSSDIADIGYRRNGLMGGGRRRGGCVCKNREQPKLTAKIDQQGAGKLPPHRGLNPPAQTGLLCRSLLTEGWGVGAV